MNKKHRKLTHSCDLCVVGGGMAGICAAIAAARHGAKVVLMQDRPVLGGNSSSECRIHVCGADRHNGIKNMRETGILEEIRLDNLHCNPLRNFSIWDTVLYEKVKAEKNIELLLNCSCVDAKMDGKKISSVTGWQLTTETVHVVKAKIFADCSGDGILAPLSGAEFRMGREARSEYEESIAPEKGDNRTMGMTCLFQAREYSSPQPYTPPAWARTFERCEDLPYGRGGHNWLEMGYWWVELGEENSIHGTEETRDELLKIVFGIWDHHKNRCENRAKAENWALEWIQFLPAKRESRRYVGAHVLTQGDVEAAGNFPDIVAYGGWSMDDHHMMGFNAAKLGEPATIFHHAPSPFGIPYGCLHSKNIANLMFAGRNASCTHAAMSSTRVMGTGAVMGQAVGTAAAMAVKKKLQPNDMAAHIPELQSVLLEDDCYLPGIPAKYPGAVKAAKLAASKGDPEPVRDGITRPIGEDLHRWDCEEGGWIAYEFEKPQMVKELTLVLDSAMDRNIALSHHQKDDQLTSPPDTLPKDFTVEEFTGGKWTALHEIRGNYQRQIRVGVGKAVKGLRFKLLKTHGSKRSAVYAFYFG